MTPKPVSIQLYTVRELCKNDFFGTLKQIAQAGYAGVEFAGLHGKAPGEVRKVLDDLGLKASSAHCGVVTKENLNQQADTAKALGYDLLIGGWKRDDWTTLEGIKRAAEAYQQAAELVKPFGMKVGYHNHWWEMDVLDGRYGMDHFLAGAPDAAPQIDTYWACNFGKVDVPAFVSKYAARTVSLHIKDGPLVEGQPHTAVGSGKMDVAKVVAAADAKVLQWLVVELDSCATDMMEAVRQSYRYLVSAGLGKGRK